MNSQKILKIELVTTDTCAISNGQKTVLLPSQRWNRVERSPHKNRWLAALASRLGCDIEAANEAFERWEPTQGREHGWGGGFWFKGLTVTRKGLKAGLMPMHYPQGFSRNPNPQFGQFDSRAPRLNPDEIAKARANGEICERWHVVCHCG